ncbi:Eisosome component PIL1-domain-containing protein [Melanogaster broomeanus]|nr:Eisosome component PIL1-domain-containing protein [Melanogaster broomeanus]
MPVPSFLSSFADKAQSAINQTPLAGHLPGTTSASDQPSANQAATQGGHRSLALESIQYQLRNLGQQYTATTPIQRIITLEKGVALDCDALARDAKAQSKDLYTWGQDEDADLRDVTDRLAYLNFVQGSLASSLAVKLDDARSPLKALRTAETNITPKRNIRAGLRNQIGRVEHNQEKGGERRLAELREQLARAEKADEHLEKEMELLKRKAVRESEQLKWDAIREYGEKLVILSQAAHPPTPANPYTGAPATAAARASLQRALDDYKTGHISLPLHTGADLSRSDTQSGAPASVQSPPVDPSALNQSPSPIPAQPNPVAPVSPVREVQMPGVVIPAATPTIAETGMPVSCCGSLRDIRAASQDAGPKSVSAEEEKRRLEREERERVLATGAGAGLHRTRTRTAPESAEDEKKRLEREEQERVLAAGRNTAAHAEVKDGDELPPYQDIQE